MNMPSTISPIPRVLTFEVPQGSPDRELIEAWNARQTAFATIEGAGSYYSARTHSPVALSEHEQADAAVYSGDAKTLEGVLAKLWVAISYCGDKLASETDYMVSDAILRADLDDVDAFRDHLDCGQEFLFHAIKNVTAMVEAL